MLPAPDRKKAHVKRLRVVHARHGQDRPLGLPFTPLPTFDGIHAGFAEKEAFAQRLELRLPAPYDSMARRGISATADIAAEPSDQANGSTQCLGCG